MVEVLSLLILVWQIIQPYLFETFIFLVGSFVLLFLWAIIQHLTAIHQNFSNVLSYLRAAKEELEKSQNAVEKLNRDIESVKDYLSEIKSNTLNIEKEMDWSDGKALTLAKQIIQRLDAIKYK